ncbi:MAG: helix-turn-helix transcriptional regulator [Solirubrobacterales bacterium]|nr:helix-turn-helix transcriptional regulator [Solirubrobacterales bacterium]
MRIETGNTDDVVLGELGERLARTRLERNLDQGQLAVEAGVSKSTVERLEAGKAVTMPSFVRILRALDLLDQLDRLLPEPLLSPIERLKTQGRQRKRASGKRGGDPRAGEGGEPGTWTWAGPPEAGGRR